MTAIAPIADNIQKVINAARPVDTVYETPENTVVSRNNIVADTRFKINSPSLQMGSSGNAFYLQNGSLLDNAVLVMTLPAIPANVYVPRGWGLLMIQQLNFQIGSATPLQLNLPQLIMDLFRMAETREKRDAIMRLCGEEITEAQQEGTINYAQVPLASLFFASVRYLGNRHLPFDSGLLSSPVLVQVYLSQPYEVFGGSGTFPTALSGMYMHLRQLNWADPRQSKRQELIDSPSSYKPYSFYYMQPFFSSPFNGSSDPNSPVTVNITGFQKGSLQSMVFMVRPIPSPVPGAINNQFAFEPVRNVVVNWNGQQLYTASNPAMWEVSESLYTNQFPISVCNPEQQESPFITEPSKAYYTNVVFAQYSETAFESIVQTGVTFQNQTVVVTFNTNSGSDVQYQLFAGFSYLATASLSNLSAQIIF